MGTDQKTGSSAAEIDAIIQVGFDVLDMLAGRFQQEMGRQFDALWSESIEGAGRFAWELFHDIRLEEDDLNVNSYVVKGRFQDCGKTGDSFVLLDAFLALIGELTISVRKCLGQDFVRQAVQSAIELLNILDKYQKDMDVVEHYREKLENAL